MARTEIPVTVSTHDGVDVPAPTPSDPSNDMEIADNDGSIILILENIGVATRTVVVKAAATFGDPPIPLTDRTYTLGVGTAASAKQTAGPFSRRLFNQLGDHSANSVLVNFDGSAGNVDVTAISVPIPTT
jgi:hypothetical protein